MKILQILMLLLLVIFCQSKRNNLKQRTSLQYQCSSVDGPQSPHEVCMDFDESKYTYCKGTLICKNNVLIRKETCYKIKPANEPVEIEHDTGICDSNEFRNT